MRTSWWYKIKAVLSASKSQTPTPVVPHTPAVASPIVREPFTPQDSVTHYVQCISSAGLHLMAYTAWGDPSNPKVLLCVHGLTRRGSDFAVLARAMSDRYYVVCPDVVGRGNSDYLANPMLYGVPQYVSDMVTLIAHLQPQQLDWFGTSMGGLIGMVLAGIDQQPIRKLLLNDVGPRIDPAFFIRLMQYLSKPVVFDSQEKGLEYANLLTTTFGLHTTEQLRELNLPQIVYKDGAWRLHYDPQINAPIMATNPMTALAGEKALWQSFDAIKIPILIVRGAESDLLSTSTLTEMCQRNPNAKAIEVPEAGHAPAFILPNQLQIARDFFQ
jgi:cobalt-zinc-cadmium efflux system protein